MELIPQNGMQMDKSKFLKNRKNSKNGIQQVHKNGTNSFKMEYKNKCKLFKFNKLIITLTRFNIHPYFNINKQIQTSFNSYKR